MTVLRTAFVNVLPRTDDFDPELKKRLGRIDASSHGERLGKGFGGAFAKTAGTLIAGVGGLFAGIAVAGFFKGAIDEAREAVKVTKLTEAVLKSTGGVAHVSAGQISDLAGALSNKVGVDDEAIQSGENLLLTFTKVRNETGKGNDIFSQASATILDMAAAMNNGQVTTDGIKSSTIQLGKALNDPIQGITALTRVGVTFSAEQKKQIENFVKAGDIMSAQKIILGELKTEFGGAAAAAADPAEKARVAWGNFKEMVGGFVLPIVTRLADLFTGKLLPALQNNLIPTLKDLVGWFKLGFIDGAGKSAGFAEQLGGAVRILWDGLRALADGFREQILPRLRDFAGFISEQVIPAVASLAGFISRNRDFFIPFVAILGSALVVFKTIMVATRLWAAAQALLNVVLTANPIGIVVVALAALAAGVIYAYKHSETFRNIVQAAWQGIQIAVSFAWNNIIKPVVMALVDYFRNVIAPTALWLWNNVFGPAFKGISFAVQVAVSIITTLFGAFVALIREVIAPTVVWLWHTIIEPAARGWILAIQTAWNFIRPVLEALGNFIRDDLVRRIQTGVAIIGALWDSLKAKAETPVRFVVDVVLNNLIRAWNTIAKAFGGTSIPPISFGGGGGGGGGGRFMALASGGVYPGYTPGRDVGLAAVSGGEAIMRPEWTRVVGKDYVEAVNAAARSGGTGGVARFLGGYAGGGIIGFLTDPAGWFKDRVGAVGDIARRFGSNPFVEMLAGGSRKLVDAAIEKAKGLLSLGGGPLGGAGGNIGWQAMWNIIHGAFPTAQLFSGYRPGDRAESGSLSYHALGRAIDITPSIVIGRWIAAHYGAMTKELIHTPMGGEQIWNGRPYTFTGAALQAAHYNHVHWAMNRGGVVDNSRPQRLDDYTIQRLAQALTGRPVNVAINGPDWGLSVAGWST